MASDLQHGERLRDTWTEPFRRHAALIGRNAAQSRNLISHRRRDLRFKILPYDAFQVVNGAVVFATAIAILVFVFDPLLPAWHEKLPESVVSFFRYVTRFGKSDWILVGTGLFLILTLIRDASALRPRLRARWAIRSYAALYVFVSVAVAGIIANVSKYVIGRARPPLLR